VNAGSRHGVRPPARRATALVRRLAAALAVASAFAAAPARPARDAPPASSAPRVLVVRLDGVVSPVMAETLDDALRRAERGRYAALVVELDTPGGLETSMREMVKSELAAPVPVIVWVCPSGARAASAGVFVTLAADVAAMAPGTNIGAATPVNFQGGMDSTLARKATNDASAFARTVASQRRRNVKWAEDAVRHAVSASETEAVELGIVDFVAGSLPELLTLADGRTWRRGARAETLHTRGAESDRLEPSFRQRALMVLADPNVAYLLMLIGFYGILFELQSPGAILPGVVGGIALILAFFALSTLPVNFAGVALIVLAIVFFVAEVKIASHGLLAAGGVIALLLGSLFLFHGEGVRVSWGVIGGGTLVTTLFFLVVVAAGVRAQRLRVQSGAEGMRGSVGVVVERLAPTGRVRLSGVLWNARSAQDVEVGSEVEVLGVEGLTLDVRARGKEART
jgi:membrane-bound serine protease (ClpP class)